MKLLSIVSLLMLIINIDGNRIRQRRFISSFRARLIKQASSLRDEQIKPRLLAQMKLGGQPRGVFTIPDENAKIDIAVNFFNTNTSTISLLRVSNVNNWLNNQSNHVKLQTVAEHIGWPEQVGEVSGEYIPNITPPYWWLTTGFNQYDQVDGQIALIPLRDDLPAIPIMMTPEEAQTKWNYWNIEWADMNQDGWPDIVASRSQGEEDSIQTSEIVWLENPGWNSIIGHQAPWTIHSVTNGPDVNFRIMKVPDKNGESKMVIIGLGYWTHKIYVIWTEDPEQDWTNVESIRERVIGNHAWYWDIVIADVNADGRDDVIVSTYAMRSWRSSIFVYEIPCDFKRDNWNRHTIVDGGDNMSDEPFNSGGKIKVFHPLVRDSSTYLKKKKPFILLAGDNDGYVKVLSPGSRSSNVWDYNARVIFHAIGPVGPVALEDLDHDGFMEIIIPVMESKRLLFFTYKPSSNLLAYDVDERKVDIDEIIARL